MGIGRNYAWEALTLYQKNPINLLSDLKKAVTSTYAIATYIIFLVLSYLPRCLTIILSATILPG